MNHQTIQKKNIISFRDYLPSDLNFILSTWLRGAYLGNHFYRLISKQAYYQNYDRVIKAILQRPGTEVRVACLVEDPTVILGYAVIEKKEILHWIFVKYVWRSIGLMSDLLEPYAIRYTTHLTDRFIESKPKRIEFNPFLI